MNQFCLALIVVYIESLYNSKYPIAGNLRGRKLLRIDEKDDFRGKKLSWIACLCCAKEHHIPIFAEKTFANNHKAVKFANVFSLESFQLYGVLKCT